MSDYLVILAGSPRGGRKTWNSLFKYVVEHLDADLALLTTDNFVSNNILFQRANYIWTINNFHNFFDYYKDKYSKNLENYFLKGKGTGLLESGLIHFAFKDIVLKKYLDIVKKYDFIIYTRFDQTYVDYHPQLSKDELSILIPTGEDYFGLCDRHAAFNSELADKFFNICEFIDSKSALDYNNKYLNCEVTYLNQFKNFNLEKFVKRSKRYQFTTATKEDKTNWRIPKYKIFLIRNLFLKYPDEFKDSINNLITKYGKLNALIKKPIFLLYFYYLSLRITLGKLINK